MIDLVHDGLHVLSSFERIPPLPSGRGGQAAGRLAGWPGSLIVARVDNLGPVAQLVRAHA